MTAPVMTTPAAMVPLGVTRDDQGRFVSRARNPIEFWGRVDFTDLDGCWPWTGTIDRQTGYGRVSWEGRLWSTHRLAFDLARGPIPKGKWVLHACDNPPCCKPEHLWLGSNSDNMADAASKNRVHPGERHGRAKLTNAQVVEIRERLAAGERVAHIAPEYGVHPNTLYSIKNGWQWKSVR